MWRISAVSPGMVDSDLFNAMFDGDKSKIDEVMENAKEILQPEDLARQIRLVLEAPKHVQVHDVIVQPTNQQF